MENDFYTNYFGPRHMKEAPVRTRPLHPLSKFIIDNDDIVKKYVEENDDGVVEWSDLVDEAQTELRLQNVERFIDLQILAANEAIRLIDKDLYRKRRIAQLGLEQPKGEIFSVQDPRNLWWITLTSDPEKSEEQNKKDIDRFRNSKFKNFKYVWVEEHGTQSELYHQHILVQGPLKKFHTKQGLKRNEGHYYTAQVIDVQRQPYTEAGINNRIKIYMSKENKPQGDVEYFLELAKTLGK